MVNHMLEVRATVRRLTAKLQDQSLRAPAQFDSLQLAADQTSFLSIFASCTLRQLAIGRRSLTSGDQTRLYPDLQYVASATPRGCPAVLRLKGKHVF